VLGTPITLALQSTDRFAAQLRRLLRSRFAHAVCHPVVAWVAFGGTLVALVFSPLLEWSVQSDLVHVVVHAHFLAVGSLFMAVFVGREPLPRPLPHAMRLLAVLLAVPFHAFVGVALLSARSPLFPSVYPALSDQRSAAALLWSSGELLTLFVAAVEFAHWWSSEQRAAVRYDRRVSSSA
jgi:putative copper resistance protein D